MCTYEHLVDATLPHGLIPLVVPQLRTITLGGAVTGLGIESTSFRNGLPHESVTEMDVFTGAGEVVTVRPGDDLFDAFVNSYGSLGYATRLRITLERVPGYVALRHVRFDDAGLLAKTMAEIVETREYDGLRVDGLDGVAFEPGEYYLTLARWSRATLRRIRPSDYAGQQIYYRSIQQRETDRPHDVRLPVALGHRLVLVLAGDGRPAPARAPGLAASLPPLRRVPPADRAQRPHRLHRQGRPAQGTAAARAGGPGRRGAGRAPRGVPRLVRPRGGHAPGVAVPARLARHRRPARPGRATRCGRGRRTSTSASGAPSTSARTPPTRRSTGRSRPRSTTSTATSRSTPRRSTTATPSTASTAAPTSPRSRPSYDPDDRFLTLYDKAVRKR